MPVPEEANINNMFHSIVTAEEWKINKLDVAELYLNDSMQPEEELDSWDGWFDNYVCTRIWKTTNDMDRG